MSERSVEETRRDFLLRLARGAALAAPVVATLRPEPLAGQKKGAGGTGIGGGKPHSVVAGGLSPATAAPLQSPTTTQQLSPWAPAAASQPPPWQRPPPTQSGG